MRLKILCLAPQETTIWDGLYWRLLSFKKRRAIASLSSGVPVGGVYLVKPFSMAAIPGFLIKSGVSKSGSPAAKLTTSTPLAFNSLTFAVIASVEEPRRAAIFRLILRIRVMQFYSGAFW